MARQLAIPLDAAWGAHVDPDQFFYLNQHILSCAPLSLESIHARFSPSPDFIP